MSDITTTDLMGTHYNQYLKMGVDFKTLKLLEMSWYLPNQDESKRAKVIPEYSIKDLLISDKTVFVYGHLKNWTSRLLVKRIPQNDVYDLINLCIDKPNIEPTPELQGLNLMAIKMVVCPKTFSDYVITNKEIIMIYNIELLTKHIKKYLPPEDTKTILLFNKLDKLEKWHTSIRERIPDKLIELKFNHINHDGGFYSVINFTFVTTVSLYNSSNELLFNVKMDMIKTVSLSTIEGKIKAYFIGTHYGTLYIFDNKFNLRTVQYFSDAIMKVRVCDDRYAVITPKKIFVLYSDEKFDCLLTTIESQSDTFFIDCDIFMDTLAALMVAKYPNKIKGGTTSMVKIYSILFITESKRELLANGRIFITMSAKNNYITEKGVNEQLRVEIGTLFELPVHFFKNPKSLSYRQEHSFFQMDLIHFQFLKESTYNNGLLPLQQNPTKQEHDNTISLFISIVDYEGNNSIIKLEKIISFD